MNELFGELHEQEEFGLYGRQHLAELEKKKIIEMNRFKEYLMSNEKAFELADEAFSLFKELYNTDYGNIYEDENLISIHTGGWSDNEELIFEFKQTGWWFLNHKITSRGGHYYFNTDTQKEKDWKIEAISV